MPYLALKIMNLLRENIPLLEYFISFDTYTKHMTETIEVLVRKALDVCVECLELNIVTRWDKMRREMSRSYALLQTTLHSFDKLQELCADKNLNKQALENFNELVSGLSSRVCEVSAYLPSLTYDEGTEKFVVMDDERMFDKMYNKVLTYVMNVLCFDVSSECKKRKIEVLD